MSPCLGCMVLTPLLTLAACAFVLLLGIAAMSAALAVAGFLLDVFARAPKTVTSAAFFYIAAAIAVTYLACAWSPI